MALARQTKNRLFDILSRDKIENPIRFAQILKNELHFVISSYMEIKKEDLDVKVSVNNEGNFELKIYGVAKRVYKAI